jgi:type IV secretory pathway TraG/TraD family ATPase VirD4
MHDHNPKYRPSFIEENPALLISLLLLGAYMLTMAVAKYAWFIHDEQLVEWSLWLLLVGVTAFVGIYQLTRAKSAREQAWPNQLPTILTRGEREIVAKAWTENCVVLGYDIHGKPWTWADETRVMQALVLGQTGSGKTTLLRNIISQDLMRRSGPPQSKIPMIILDGKGDLEFFESLLPYIQRAGRMADLRLLNPSRPELSVQYNPFYTDDDNYGAQVSMIFGSFDLRDEFFAPHQMKYLGDIVRILHYTGKRFNFYDVMVMALDPGVIEDQVAMARSRIAHDSAISSQRRLNFEMSVKNLYQSFADRERVAKIQGLLNECMTFLDDELSIITGSYDNLLSIDEVIDEQLILFVSLNINKNTAPVRALGKMLLQNLQLVVGKRYESESERKRKNRPLCSVVMDEFAPFGYRNFAQILNTSRGTNTAFLFSMQSLPQLLQVGKGFQQDVSSAPGTTMLLQTRDEETAKYFKQASAQVPVQKRSQQLWRKHFLGFERFEKTTGATEREQLEYRALDHHIKNLGKGKMEILMTDAVKGTLHGRLHVRPPADVRVPCCEPVMFPKLNASRADQQGANLRFKDQKLAATIALPRRFGAA